MADIFVSYTSSDNDWANWIGLELEKLGHVARVHEWEISAGGNIPAWMEERHQKADHVLFVISKLYLTKDYSNWERLSAEWAAVSKRPGFGLPVFIEECETPTLLAPFKRCDLYGLNEEDARAQLSEYLTPARKPTAARFPSARTPAPAEQTQTIPFPGGKFALSNIPIAVPRYFLGRDDALEAIDAALKGDEGRVAITALHGLRGVGKTTLAAAYAERHRNDYRATWWIRAQTEATMRADLVALGVRLGWVAADEKEEPALTAVRERLREEGEGLLLIYDNAIDPSNTEPYLPIGSAAHALVTSNAPAWGKVAEPIPIDVWSKDTGAKFLIARTKRSAERADAEALSVVLGGLPLAHEQAAAYCERLEKSLEEYRKRFNAAPARWLDTERDAPAEYHNKLTAAKSFALAIDEAAKLHPAAEPLIVHAALLAPEPIPLFLFSGGREKFGEPLASLLVDDGLDEAVAALRAFALVDRETIADERDPAIVTETIRLHRLVRAVASGRLNGDAADATRRVLIEAMAEVYPATVFDDPGAWPRARRLDALAFDLVGGDAAPPESTEAIASYLLERLASYRQAALAAYAESRALFERALAIREHALGPEHPSTATSLNDLALLLKVQGDLAGARPLFERALGICEKTLGPDHLETATSLKNLAFLRKDQGDLAGARPLFERALSICEKTLGPDHPDTATSLKNLAFLRKDEGDLAGAGPLFERALGICENTLGPAHPETATSLINLAFLRTDQGDLAGARPLFERALAIREKVLGPEHPDTATGLNNLASLLKGQGDLAGARPLFERALTICEKALGPEHPDTARSLNNLALLLWTQGDLAGARPLYERALAIREQALGPEHPDTARSLNNLALLLQAQGDLAGARPLHERALAIHEQALGPEHPDTAESLNNLALLLHAQGDLAGARPLHERALAIHEKALGPGHPSTATSLDNLALLFQAQGDLAGARPLYERALAIREKALGPEHPVTATSLKNLAFLRKDQGDLAGARPLFERALSICEKTLGPDHPDTATSLKNLAFLRKDEGDLAGAGPLFERALGICENTLGPAHPETATSLINLAFLRTDQGDLAGARPLFERALAIREKVLGPEHPDTATGLNNLARLFQDLGDFREAERLFGRAIVIGKKALGGSHQLTQHFQSHYAHLLLMTNRPGEALPLAESALAVHGAANGANHPWTKWSSRVTSDALDALGRADEAAALRARHRLGGGSAR